MGGSHEKSLVLFGCRGMFARGGNWVVEAGWEPTSCVPCCITIARLRLLQNQSTGGVSGQASRPCSMRCLPHVQQRRVQIGAALTRKHDLERGAVASEFRAGQAGCRTRLLGEQADQTSARRRGRWRSPSRGAQQFASQQDPDWLTLKAFVVGEKVK